MGYYTGTDPAPNQTLMQRLSNAVDMDPYSLAQAAGVNYEELLDAWQSDTGQLSAAGVDPMWETISKFIDMRIAVLMAAREELRVKLVRDTMKRRKHAERIRK